MYRLENWAVAQFDPYSPPEANDHYLVGEVYDHPKYEDGYRIHTSRPVKAEGLLVTTSSGSVYKLGEIDPDYLKYLKDSNYNYDPANPIKIKAV